MPILGGFGNASEYAYRSFISEIPNQYNWIDLYNVEPGVEHRAGYAKITGIKSALPVRVSAGTSFSLISNVFDNGQTVTFDNNYPIIASFDDYSNPNNRFQPGLGDNVTCAFINSDVSINLSITPPKNLKTDFSKTYTTLVSVGKTSQDWIVSTRPIDETPTLFSFSGITTTTNTFVESNQIVLSGLEPGFSFTSQITSGIGTISVNNVDRGSSYDVSNGDTIKLKTKSSNLFNTNTNVVLKVGTYSTTWNVTTEQENLNITFTPTDFTDQSSVDLSSVYSSNQITLSGFSLNSDLPVTLSNTNATYEIERGGSVIKSFESSPIEVVNNDKIRLRLTSSSSYSTAVSTNMTIGNKTVDWKVTTRSAPPPPDIQPPPPCVVRTASSTYGTGFFGYVLYGNNTRTNLGFMTGLNSNYPSGRTVYSGIGISTTYGSLSSAIINYYTGTIRRYPEAAGFDGWINRYQQGAFFTLQNLVDEIDQSYKQPGGERDIQQQRGGQVGNFDECNNKIV